jgi:hydrogenase maturation protein HypF
MTTIGARTIARRIHVRGVVQGVGFRPYVWRLAQAHALRGWVRNGGDGVSIHVEGEAAAVDAFVRELRARPPSAAAIAEVDVTFAGADPHLSNSFDIIDSASNDLPTTRISPDLPICDECLKEIRNRSQRRHLYAYINCTNCGPRYSIVRALPYDRARTTMAKWPLCARCAAEYTDPGDRRFHAQPIACPVCGPHYVLSGRDMPDIRGVDAIRKAARMLRAGQIVAVKGIGGYHLACDAENAAAVALLRVRKYRKEQAFAVMTRDLDVARATIEVTPDVEALLLSSARPIVIAPARVTLGGVAPGQLDLGVILPYAPVHFLLFDAGAPPRIVMTSGNRSSEPIAYEDEDACARLSGLADAILAGERPIARRVDDSVIRSGPSSPTIVRRSRGLAPSAVATLPVSRPVLALGGDLKNAITLVVEGAAFVSQHIGDLSHHDALRAFDTTVHDLLEMYGVRRSELLVAHDAHPQYASSSYAATLDAGCAVSVQHHRAHVASVLAERGELDRRVISVALDGTGYGDDGTIWGGELFAGSVQGGFARVGHLRPVSLPGGDAAARHPVQAAAGFLAELPDGRDFSRTPFFFPERFAQAQAVLRGGLRTFASTSTGRLFDAVAALSGFTRPVTFEGQAAMWLEHLARGVSTDNTQFDMVVTGAEVDWRPTLRDIVRARSRGVPIEIIARAFHRTLAHALVGAIRHAARTAGTTTVVLSGGVMQNALLQADLRDALIELSFDVWTNRVVPPNDGGLSLGQAALAALTRS